jgi:transposase
MMIIGCDFHPSWQQVSWLDTETGDCGERKLVHASGDAKLFYQQLAAPVLIGIMYLTASTFPKRETSR